MKEHNNLIMYRAASVANIKSAIDDAMATAELATAKAIQVGHLLVEAKADPRMQHGDWQEWIETNFPQITIRTANRWMQAATNVARQVDLGGCEVPISRLLSDSAEQLPDDNARAAKQTLFDFMADKTINDCLVGIVRDGDEAHRVTRAANGRKFGGHKGEDRKDWPKYIGVHLNDILQHLKSWKSFSPAQVADVFARFDTALAKMPPALLTHLKQRITEELKSR